MTKIDDLRNQILEIKRKLLLIASNSSLSCPEDVEELYREYLKIYVQFDHLVPQYSSLWPYYNNCYFYALNLPTPQIFSETFKKVLPTEFGILATYVGLISKSRIRYERYIWSQEKLLDCVNADLDTLKIKSYPIELLDNPHHDGYKVAIFYDAGSKLYHIKPDYHFVRQNQDGSWSEKLGYNSIIKIHNNPLETAMNSDTDLECYEYVKTLELVKPTIRK